MKVSSKILVLLTGFVFILALAAIAQEKQSEETITCPVSGKVMKKSEAKATYEYKGKTYYFCCENSKEMFVKDPEKYLQGKPGEKHECCEEADTAVDPTCGMKIKKSEAKINYEYEGKTYYFCSEECKEKFVKEPEKYIKKEAEAVTCPVTGEKIADTKAAPSYDYKGKTYYFCCEKCKEKFTKDPEKYIQKKDEKKAE